MLFRSRVERRNFYPTPIWPQAERLVTDGARRVRSGELEIAVAPRGGFRFAVGGTIWAKAMIARGSATWRATNRVDWSGNRRLISALCSILPTGSSRAAGTRSA